MNAINIRQLIAIIATILLQTRADIASVGRNFEVVFPINNAETASETSISLEFIRYEFSYLNIRVNYPIFTLNGSELTRTTEEKSTYVWYSRTATLTFEGTSIYRNLTVGLQSYPDMRFIITSDDLMQVIAHNYATDGSGDSFTVLPTKMAGKSYAVSVPETKGNGFATVYLLPIYGETQIDVEVVRPDASENGIKVYNITTDGSNTIVYRGSNEAFTLYAYGSRPFHVVVGIREYTYNQNESKASSMSLMQTPMPGSECRIRGFYHHYMADMRLSENFIVSPPSAHCRPFFAQAEGVQNGSLFGVFPARVQPIRSWPPDFGDFGEISSQVTYLQSVRLGGGRMLDGRRVGVFMDMILPWSQYVSGLSYFVTRSNNDIMTVIADAAAMSDTYFDGGRISDWVQFTQINGTAYYYTKEIPTAGSHFVTSTGFYALQITGFNSDGSSYGYTPTVNDDEQSEPAYITTTAMPPTSKTPTTSTPTMTTITYSTVSITTSASCHTTSTTLSMSQTTSRISLPSSSTFTSNSSMSTSSTKTSSSPSVFPSSSTTKMTTYNATVSPSSEVTPSVTHTDSVSTPSSSHSDSTPSRVTTSSMVQTTAETTTPAPGSLTSSAAATDTTKVTPTSFATTTAQDLTTVTTKGSSRVAFDAVMTYIFPILISSAVLRVITL